MTKLPSGKLDIKLIALDLDDTLLDDKQSISDGNVIALREAANRGIYVVLCSGRAEDAIVPFVRRLDIAGTVAGRYIIAINGCSVYDMHKRQGIFSRLVPGDVLLRASELAESMGLYAEVYTPDTIYYRKETKWTKLDVDLCHLKGREVEDFDSFVQKGFPKMLIPGDPDLLQELQTVLKNEFGERAVIFTSKPFFLELLPPSCGKGEAITWLAEHLGLDIKQTMGFGDSMNDESMIRLCGSGVAMCNGLEYIQNIADYVTEKDNNHSGVGDFITKYVL